MDLPALVQTPSTNDNLSLWRDQIRDHATLRRSVVTDRGHETGLTAAFYFVKALLCLMIGRVSLHSPLRERVVVAAYNFRGDPWSPKSWMQVTVDRGVFKGWHLDFEYVKG